MPHRLVTQLMKPLRNSRGAAAVMVALTLTVLLAMGAAAIDIGHALVARNELQNAADAAALAGARTLGIAYEGMTPAQMATYTLTGGDQAAIVAAAQTTSALNQAAAVNVAVNAADVQVGLWNSGTKTFTPTANQPRSVRVVTHRDGSANGPISTFLANVVGMSTVNVSAAATAELTAIGSTPPGALDFPVAISELFFSQFGLIVVGAQAPTIKPTAMTPTVAFILIIELSLSIGIGSVGSVLRCLRNNMSYLSFHCRPSAYAIGQHFSSGRTLSKASAEHALFCKTH